MTENRRITAVINARFAQALEGTLPDWIEPLWFTTLDELFAIAPRAEIGWFDVFDEAAMQRAVDLAEDLKWLHSLAAGVDAFPLETLKARGIPLTNGAGQHATALAEYAVLGMLVIAKGYREVVRSQERGLWQSEVPGTQALEGSRALIVGSGGIGRRIGELLRPFGVEVTDVRRNPAPGVLTPGEWQQRLGEFDWVILVVPATPETDGLMGKAEFAAMKPGASVLNFARGAVIDQDALIEAARSGHLGGAFLDVTDPEPLPAGHPLWSLGNVHVTSHLSGRSSGVIETNAAGRFLRNLEHFRRGEEMEAVVNLELGY